MGRKKKVINTVPEYFKISEKRSRMIAKDVTVVFDKSETVGDVIEVLKKKYFKKKNEALFTMFFLGLWRERKRNKDISLQIENLERRLNNVGPLSFNFLNRIFYALSGVELISGIGLIFIGAQLNTMSDILIGLFMTIDSFCALI